jgi:hypothetical protein
MDKVRKHINPEKVFCLLSNSEVEMPSLGGIGRIVKPKLLVCTSSNSLLKED